MEDRDFIDFEFNGHWASEFNLLAVSNSDRYSNSFYGTVNANTADMVGKYGVYKWKTQIGEKRFSINIAYDNVDLNTLRKIKEWLNPFVIGKLVFKEEPYKYYWVSLAEDPEISFLPFLTEETVVDGRRLKKGVYKGEFVINFVCFDNYGYSDWNSFDENYDYIVKELEISDDEVNFDDGSDNSLIISQIDGNLKQNKESQAYYSTSQESNRLTLNNITNTDTEKWSIKGGNSQVVQNYNSTRVEGESFDLNDVDNSKTMDIQLKGNHSQEIREGYNLLDMSNAKGGESAGITCTMNKDGSYKYAGTAINTTINVWLLGGYNREEVLFSLVPGTYYVDGVHLFYKNTEVADVSRKNIFTFTETQYVTGVRALSATIGETYNKTVYPIIALSNKEVQWEQYGASPSPDYPSEIKTVGGNENLLDGSKASTKTANGMTLSYSENEGLMLNGTTTALTNFWLLNLNEELEAGNYTLSSNVSLENSGVYVLKAGSHNLVQTKTKETTFEISKTTVTEFLIQINAGVTFNNQSLKIKLEKGSNATHWSKYGQGCIEEKVVNKNWVTNFENINNTSSGITITGNKDNVKATGTATDTWLASNYVELENLQAGNYIFSYSSKQGLKYKIWISNSEKSAIIYNLSLNEKISVPKNYKKLFFRIVLEKLTVGQIVNDTVYFQLEKGSTATDFVAHKEQVITMPVQQEMLEGDYIKDVEHHGIGKYVFTGEEAVTISGSRFQVTYYKIARGKTAQPSLCNISTYADWALTGKHFNVSNSDCYFTMDNFDFSTAEEMKAYLKAQYEAGTPVKIYYPLVTPINLELTSEQKAAAKQFKAITPYKDTTHIYSTDKIAPKMVVDYNITRAMPSPDYPSEIETVGSNVNLFDKDNVITRHRLNVEGLNYSDVNYFVSDYIEMKEKTTCVKNTVISAYQAVSYYDKEKKHIKRNTTENPFTTPAGTCYIKICDLLTNLDTLKLEKGSVATSYSPYGIGSVEIDVTNRNLLYYTSENQTIKGIDYTINQDKSIKVKGTATEYSDFYLCGTKNQYEDIGLVGTFNISGCNSGNSSKYMLYVVKKDKFGGLEYYQNVAGDTKLIISEGDTLRIFIRVLTGVTVDDVIYPMLRVSTDTDSSYIEAKKQTAIIPIQQDMLEGDYFDFDREKEVHNWNKLVLTGDETFYYSVIQNDYMLFQIDKRTEMLAKSEIICNNLKYESNWNIDKESIYYGGSSGKFIQMKILSSRLTEATEQGVKEWLKSKSNEGNPVIVYYKTTEPTELDFTDEQKTVARQLKRSNFYRGTTNVILDNDLAKVKVNYDGYDGAPSEKHPSSVDGVKDKVDITVKNKNILSIPNSSNTSNGLTITYMNGTYKITGTPTINWAILTPEITHFITKGKYVLSYEVEGEKDVDRYQLEPTFIYKNGEKKKWWLSHAMKKSILEFTENVDKINISLSGFEANKATNITLKIQLEKGEESTDIIEPKQQQISLPVQEEMYIGDYIDETGEHHKMTKIVIDGTNTRVSMTKRAANYIQTYLNTSEQFDPQVDINCYSNIMNQEYNERFGFINTFVKNKIGIYFHFKSDLLGDADCNDIGMNNWFKEQYDKGTPAYIIGPLKEEKVLPLTDEQKSALNILKNYTYSYPGANTISVSGDTKPKITASYIPQQDINIDFVLEGSNLLNDSAFYYNNDIYLKAFDEVDSGNPSTSGISSEREVYLYNAGNADASLKLTFDLIIPAENSPLTIVTSKGHFTKNGFEEINNYSQFSISNFAHYKPFIDIFDGILSNWIIEIDSDLCEVYLKHKTNKDKVISLNRFNDNQSFLKLAGSDFVDYSKSFPTSLEEIKDSAIENTIFNKISLKESAQNYRLKNVSLDWKHTYL